MRIPVVNKDGKALMPTTPCRCRKLVKDGIAERKWTKEGIFYLQMLHSVGKETQDMCLAIDPGSKYDGYCVSGRKEVVLMGMAVLPSRVKKRMKTRSALRKARRRRNCRRREARFNNRKKKKGWIAPSQLAKVQLRIRLMERLCMIFPVSNIVIEDVKFHSPHKYCGRYFSTVEIGKTRVYEIAKKLATFNKCRGWETAETRKTFNIAKISRKGELKPSSHANDALAMVCWLFEERPQGVAKLFIWRRQECSKRQLYLQNFAKGGIRRRQGGTTDSKSTLRKGDIVKYKDTIGYVGGWFHRNKTVSLVNSFGKRFNQVVATKVELLERSPNILTERSAG